MTVLYQELLGSPLEERNEQYNLNDSVLQHHSNNRRNGITDNGPPSEYNCCYTTWR